MGKRIKIRPKDGLKVPKPLSTTFLRAEGEDVEQTSYWIRRINEGAVELVEESEKISPKEDPKDSEQEEPKKKTKKKSTKKKKADQEDES